MVTKTKNFFLLIHIEVLWYLQEKYHFYNPCCAKNKYKSLGNYNSNFIHIVERRLSEIIKTRTVRITDFFR